MTSNKKNKGTLLSSTLKVEEKKVFKFQVNLVRYGDFNFLPFWPFLGPFLKLRPKSATSKRWPFDLKFHTGVI